MKKKLIILASIFITLNIIDAFLTSYGLKIGLFTEGNLIIAYIIENAKMWGFWAYKLILSGLICFALLWKKKMTIFLAINIFMAIVCTYNAVLLGVYSCLD